MGEGQPPVILWFRRDLRLDDHRALTAAIAAGRPVVPVFVHDETVEALGAAARFRLGAAVQALAEAIAATGGRLILRRGRAEAVLAALVAETGARDICWTRYPEPTHLARDAGVVAMLDRAGVRSRAHAGTLLFDPRAVVTGAGRAYEVFTPFWRAIRDRDPGRTLAAPARWPAPDRWPASEALADWRMEAAMGRGAAIVARHVRAGESIAAAKLDRFLAERAPAYAEGRDYPARNATSGLSDHLAWGEISPRRIWWAASVAGAAGAEKFRAELAWREFAWHLMVHRPDVAMASWRAGWDRFPWRGDNPDAERWRRGMTGVAFVDAGMREMYVTGRMHNRARMVAASYLTKHLLTDWRVGLAWFQDCLTDWDPASNALGWQWVAGSGPDAAPYFRIFNPDAQAARFDADGFYRTRWIAEGAARPSAEARGFFDAAPRSWRLDPSRARPGPIISHEGGRARALAAWDELRAASS